MKSWKYGMMILCGNLKQMIGYEIKMKMYESSILTSFVSAEMYQIRSIEVILELLETSNFIEIGTPQGCLQIQYLQIETFSQYSLILGERPINVLHLNIKTDPYKSALPKITIFEHDMQIDNSCRSHL